MKVSFPQVEEPSTALVPQAPGTLTQYTEEEADRNDLVTPTLYVVAKVGDLSNIFDAGSLVLDKTTLLVKKDVPLEVIAASITKSYQEKTVFGEEMGDRANSLAEVRAKGGQIEDRDAEHFWIPVARVILLVKQTPAVHPDAEPLFFQQIGEDNYLLAQYWARNSAYTAVAKPLFTLKAMQGAPSKLVYKLTSSLHTFDGNTWFRPNLRPAGKTSLEVTEFISTRSL